MITFDSQTFLGMKQVLGYFLGFAIFIIGIPALMWLVSGRPAFADLPTGRLYLSVLLAIAGLSLSVWSIIYMKRVGKGNPFDAMGHEVAPRTRHLMTDGPYKLSRNPMLSGTYLYYAGILVASWNWWALLVFAVVAGVMLLQVRSEEKRLEADFGDEYLDYKKHTGRFITLKK
jgi:protein-S-isoprenylcysteine O-methyltransferase Ste14